MGSPSFIIQDWREPTWSTLTASAGQYNRQQVLHHYALFTSRDPCMERVGPSRVCSKILRALKMWQRNVKSIVGAQHERIAVRIDL